MDDGELLKEALANEAEEAVYRTMIAAESSGHHTTGSWVYEGRDHHMRHAQDHFINIMTGNYKEGSVDIEFDHLVCRVMMAYWSQTAGIIDDAGPEGVNRPRA